jgi:hypothetical protein
MQKLRRRVLCLALTSGACFSSGGAEGPSLVGDWFVCMDADCAEIDDDGVRFNADGTWVEIDSNEQLVGDEPVCAEVRTGPGLYTFDGDSLCITSDGAETTRAVELRGDRLTLFGTQPFSSDGTVSTIDVLQRRVRTFEADDCDDDAPQVGGDPGLPDTR